MRHGLFVALFGELSEPAVVAELGAEAEAAGFSGLFVWDHVLYAPHVERIADPWVTLAAVACVTRSLLLGPMVTPVGRRRPHKLARETVTLDSSVRRQARARRRARQRHHRRARRVR